MSRPPEDFPLEPFDFEGNEIKVGNVVKILKIPEWLIHDLDTESAKIVKSCEGANMEITEIDEYGYAWVEKVSISTEENYQSNSFCMEPENLLLQKFI